MTDSPSGSHRIEHDSLGEVRVPADALWGPQTQRAVENFPVSGERIAPAHVAALAMIKAAAARANGALGVIDGEVAEAIAAAAADVAAGTHDEHFPVDVFQTGSGTSSNMNANEVIATLASERLGRRVHPNDEVNASQSSNDVFPTSVHVAAAQLLVRELVPSLDELHASLTSKARDLDDVVTAGRTHLMDAVPVTLGQVFDGYASQVAHGVDRLRSTLDRVCELPLGGTATGTGLNAVPGFATAVIGELATRTGLPLREAPDHFEAQGARDALVELSGQLRVVAVSLTKVANDLRWRSSGPRAGIGELHLPDLQPGSSIMPGKVNPVVPEAVLQVCAQVVGNDTAVGIAGASGSFELNVMVPVIARNVLESERLLANAARLLAHRCVDGITADEARCLELAESSPAIVTALNRYLGYDDASTVAKLALARRATIRDTVLAEGYVERGVLTEAQLDEALDVRRMARGG
jgi:fumarate hydratase class II